MNQIKGKCCTGSWGRIQFFGDDHLESTPTVSKESKASKNQHLVGGKPQAVSPALNSASPNISRFKKRKKTLVLSYMNEDMATLIPVFLALGGLMYLVLYFPRPW
jgi:hypothetical protein